MKKAMLKTGFLFAVAFIAVLAGVSCVTLPDLDDLIPPTTTTTTSTTTTTTTDAIPEVSGKDPDPVHPAVFSVDGCIILKSRPAGYVNNADNSRQTVKTVLPPEYTDLVARCLYFDGKGFKDSPRRGPSHEVGNRERFYGTLPVSAYPASGMWVRWDTVVNGKAKDYCFWVANPRERLGDPYLGMED